MFRFLAHIFTFITHPLWIPTWTYAALLTFFPNVFPVSNEEFKIQFLASIWALSFGLPCLLMLALRFLKRIENLSLNNIKDRAWAYGTTFVVYLMFFYLAYFQFKIQHPLVMLFLVMTLGLGLVWVINFWFKISAHAYGLISFLTLMLLLIYDQDKSELFMRVEFFILLTGASLSSRLYLNAHSPREILWGSVLGGMMGTGGFWILVS